MNDFEILYKRYTLKLNERELYRELIESVSDPEQVMLRMTAYDISRIELHSFVRETNPIIAKLSQRYLARLNDMVKIVHKKKIPLDAISNDPLADNLNLFPKDDF